MTRAQFIGTFRVRTSYGRYAAEVGAAAASVALDNAFDESLRCMPAGGFWTFGQVQAAAGQTNLRFQDHSAAATFLGAIDMLVGFDVDKIKNRRLYIAGLIQEAQHGSLYTKLTNATEPAASYFVAPAPRAAVHGAPPVPPKPINWDKARQWVTSGVHGPTDTYMSTLARLRRTNGSFPLGQDDQILRHAWQSLVPHAPSYRGWSNNASMQKYPSNVGGTKLLNELLADFGGRAMPAKGATAWYDLALCVYASAMTAQAFTDGNKRICRVAYALVLLSGEVPFLAPTAALGATLADMM